MPCPDALTPRQCRLRDALAHKLARREDFKGDPWAVATQMVEKRKETHHGQ